MIAAGWLVVLSTMAILLIIFCIGGSNLLAGIILDIVLIVRLCRKKKVYIVHWIFAILCSVIGGGFVYAIVYALLQNK